MWCCSDGASEASVRQGTSAVAVTDCVYLCVTDIQFVVVWCCGVNLRLARLVLGWVTASGFNSRAGHFYLDM